MKRFVIKLIFFTPFLFIIITVNYFVDPAHVYDDEYGLNIAKILLSGQCATNLHANFDERCTKKTLAENYQKRNIDNLILGSSRVMLIGDNVLPEQNNLNLGVSSARIEDIIAMYMICKESGIKTKRLLIGIDPQYFNDNNGNVNWLYYSNYYFDYLNSISDSSNHTKERTFENSKVKNLVSMSYFRESVKYLLSNDKRELISTMEYDNIYKTFHPDGSLSYDKFTRDRDQVSINKAVQNWKFKEWDDFLEISNYYVKKLKHFIIYASNDNVEIVFVLLPWHPILYDIFASEKQYKILFDTMIYITNFAQNEGIKTIGSFNPIECGCNETCFYDGAHLNPKGLNMVFHPNHPN